jgi:hypothetical protein
MSATQRGGISKCDGYVLLAVVIFVFVITLAGATFFRIGSSETTQALYRQRSCEAFCLADGAIERSRAKLLEDRAWRDGWTHAAAGHGTYDLSIADTTYGGMNDVVRLTATGDVRNARRRIEALAEVPPTATDLPLLIGGNADIKGNLCLGGEAHVNGDGYDPHLTCGGTYTDQFVITPPPIYTDPAHFPNATYYFVRGNKVGSNTYARIYNATGQNISVALGDSLTGGLVSYNAGSKTFTYNFDTAARISAYFDETTGVFHRIAGTSGVVVNFGEPPILTPPGNNGLAEVVLDGSSGASSLRTTIINTRFTGATEAERLDPLKWMGGLMTVKQLTWEPAYGVAMIAYDFQKQGGSLVHIGSEAWPALLYITRNVPALNSNFELIGSLICLGDFHSSGGPNITFNGGFVPNLPDYLSEDWTAGVSGTLKVLTWREVAVAS